MGLNQIFLILTSHKNISESKDPKILSNVTNVLLVQSIDNHFSSLNSEEKRLKHFNTPFEEVMPT